MEKRAGVMIVKLRSIYFRLGEAIQGVTFPGESLTRNGLAIKKAMKVDQRLLLGLTLGSCSILGTSQSDLVYVVEASGGA